MNKQKINKKVRKKLFSTLKIIWFVLGSLFLLITALTDLWIISLENWDAVPWEIFGGVYSFLGIWAIITSLFIIGYLIKKYAIKILRKKDIPKTKKQKSSILEKIWFRLGVLFLFLFSFVFVRGLFIYNLEEFLNFVTFLVFSTYALEIWGAITLIFLLIKWLVKKWKKKK